MDHSDCLSFWLFVLDLSDWLSFGFFVMNLSDFLCFGFFVLDLSDWLGFGFFVMDLSDWLGFGFIVMDHSDWLGFWLFVLDLSDRLSFGFFVMEFSDWLGFRLFMRYRNNWLGLMLCVMMNRLILNFNNWFFDRFFLLLGWYIWYIFNRVIKDLLLCFIVSDTLLMCGQLIFIICFDSLLGFLNLYNFLGWCFRLNMLNNFGLNCVFKSTLLRLSCLSLHNFLVFFGKQILVFIF